MRILIIKLMNHGDVLLITPVINTLKQYYKNARIDVLLYEETREILKANTDIDCIYGAERRRQHSHRLGYLINEWRLLRNLRRHHYHLVLNFSDQWRSALYTSCIGVKQRIGFNYAKRQNWLWRTCHTQLVSTQTHQNKHIVEQNLSILTPLNLSSYSQRVTMSYTHEDWQYCQSLLPATWHGNYLVIHPMARWYFKSCPESIISEVIIYLSAMNYNIVLTGSSQPQEMQAIQNILARCPAHHLISLAGNLTLRQLASLIDNSKLFIGVDSVPMHMAAALQTPIVALFGPSKIHFWRPWQALAEIIWAGDYSDLPEPDAVDTDTKQRYLEVIPPKSIIHAALRILG